jgi:hypothetical protein
MSETTDEQLRKVWVDLVTLIRNQASDEIKFILIGARIKLEILAHERGLDLWKSPR